MNYYIMAKQFSTFTGAAYDDNQFVLSGTRPDFDGHIVDWSQSRLDSAGVSQVNHRETLSCPEIHQVNPWCICICGRPS